MTEQELRKLRRGDLLDLLLDLTKENEILRAQLDQTRKQLANRTIAIEKSGSIAEASLRLNGVFEAAQAACEQYTLNLRQRTENLEQKCREVEKQNLEKEQATQEKCDQMLRETEIEAKIRMDQIQELADACMNKAKEEAFALQMQAQKDADAIRKEAEAIRKEAEDYKAQVDSAVKGIADSYSWLNKVIS
jgi:hypothetical protein